MSCCLCCRQHRDISDRLSRGQAVYSEADSAAFGEEYLKTIAFLYPFIGINFVLNGVVRAAGAMFQILVLNVISFWVLRYPFTYLFSKWLGENGIALGIGMASC